MNKTFIANEADGTKTEVSISKVGETSLVETNNLAEVPVTRKSKKPVDLKAIPKQSDDTPKTKKRYFYEKTGNYVSYARAKQLGLVP